MGGKKCKRGYICKELYWDPDRNQKKKWYYEEEINKAPPITASSTNASCNNSNNKGFGFTGKCLHYQHTVSRPTFPGVAKVFMDGIFFPFLNVFPSTLGIEVCVGDYAGKSILTDTGLSTTSCSNFPLNTSFNYGFFEFDIKQFPCGNPTQVTCCLGFDSCGTVIATVNGGVTSCLAHYGTAVMAEMITP